MKTQYLLKVILCAVIVVIIGLACFNSMRPAESQDAGLIQNDIIQQLEEISAKQERILKRLDMLEEEVIKEVKIRCTK